MYVVVYGGMRLSESNVGECTTHRFAVWVCTIRTIRPYTKMTWRFVEGWGFLREVFLAISAALREMNLKVFFAGSAWISLVFFARDRNG
jgi:hypothetical protein